MYGTSWFKVLFSLHSRYSHSLNSLLVVITNRMKGIFESIRRTYCVIGICIEPEVEPKTGKRPRKKRGKQKKNIHLNHEVVISFVELQNEHHLSLTSYVYNNNERLIRNYFRITLRSKITFHINTSRRPPSTNNIYEQ